MLSMPRGTDPLLVQRAVREFAKMGFADHRYVMVLHDHHAYLHVHLSVRAESKHGQRLNPRKADMHRWREVFAERLREWGVDAGATRQPTRGEQRKHADLWRGKAKEQGRLREVVTPKATAPNKSGARALDTRREAQHAWAKIAIALRDSVDLADQALSKSIQGYLSKLPSAVELSRHFKAKQAQKVREPCLQQTPVWRARGPFEARALDTPGTAACHVSQEAWR
jgi:hypothetical protein